MKMRYGKAKLHKEQRRNPTIPKRDDEFVQGLHATESPS